jgi:hypothetical protein
MDVHGSSHDITRGMVLEGLRKNVKNVKNVTWAPPKYKSEASLLEPTFVVKFIDDGHLQCCDICELNNSNKFNWT